MLTRHTRNVSAALVSILLLATVATPAGAVDEDDAAAYCSGQGGNVVDLVPYLAAGTDSQVELGGSLKVCQFITQEGDNPVQVVVDLTTLHSEHPTLAGLAYLAMVPSSNSGSPGSNPASSYCPDDLGGTEAFGTQATGAWVGALDPGMEAGYSEPLGNTINLCVFADRSAIDDFALFYHSTGETRGTDLAEVMRYQADDATPAVFDAGADR